MDALRYIWSTDTGQDDKDVIRNLNKKKRNFSAKSKKKTKEGKLCRACGLKRSVTNKCECNE